MIPPRPTFTLKKLVLALALAGYTMGSAYAVLTSPTGQIQGTAPVLSAPSNDAIHAVDFSSSAQGSVLASGDTITLTYDYKDTDGDADNSTAHVKWYYVNDGTETEITAGIANVAATESSPGTSTLTIPAVAIGADKIKVEIQEYAASGIPLSGDVLTIDDTHEGIGGGLVTPPGPVIPGVGPNSGVTPGIYRSSDTTFTTNLVGSSTPLAIGETYVFKLWDTEAIRTTDLTDRVKYNWRLVGTSATDNITAPAQGFETTVSDSNFTIPTNTQPNGTPLTGSVDGAQGFNLAVDYN